MAKQSSLFKVEGTIDGVTFYKSKNGHLIRKAGGISKNRILTDNKFVRTRENMNEFSLLAKTNRLIRNALAYQLKNIVDPGITNRLTTKLSEIKNFDNTSPRGQRSAAIGMATTEGKTAMTGFDFNSKAQLSSILLTPYKLDTATGTVTVDDFAPASDILIPQGATHVNIVSIVSKIDFVSESYDTVAGKPQLIPVDAASANISIVPDTLPQGYGITFYVLLIEFYQQVNGASYSLKNGAFNVLNIMNVL